MMAIDTAKRPGEGDGEYMSRMEDSLRADMELDTLKPFRMLADYVRWMAEFYCRTRVDYISGGRTAMGCPKDRVMSHVIVSLCVLHGAVTDALETYDGMEKDGAPN
jgi:hypothetical protein